MIKSALKGAGLGALFVLAATLFVGTWGGAVLGSGYLFIQWGVQEKNTVVPLAFLTGTTAFAVVWGAILQVIEDA